MDRTKIETKLLCDVCGKEFIVIGWFPLVEMVMHSEHVVCIHCEADEKKAKEKEKK